MDKLEADQEFLFRELSSEHVKTAVWQAWERLPDNIRVFLRTQNIVVREDTAWRDKKSTQGYVLSGPPDENRIRHLWLDNRLTANILVGVVAHEFAHLFLLHADMLWDTRGADQLKMFCDQHANWLCHEVWGFDRTIQ